MADSSTHISSEHLLGRRPWLAYVLPFAMFMGLGTISPSPDDPGWLPLGMHAYPVFYTVRIACTLATIAFAWPALRTIPGRISPWSLVVGALGVVAWVGLCELGIESRLLHAVGLGDWASHGARDGYNPLSRLAETPLWAIVFLVVRFIGLAVAAPVVEELLLRGFVWRVAAAQDWQREPFGRPHTVSILAATILGMTMHPVGEWLAYAVWFSMVTLLFVRTRSLWDCIVAHAVTNLLLGVYVLSTGEWRYL